MVSSSRQTYRRRTLKHAKFGRTSRRLRNAAGTPAFPIHPPNYPADAPDAKPDAKAADKKG